MKDSASQVKRRVLSFGCLVLQAFLSAGAFGAVVCVKPPVGANSTPDIVAAVGRLADGDVLRFAEGEYHLFQDGTLRIPLGPSGNLAGTKNVVVSLAGRKRIVIDGGGSTFVVHGGVFPLAVRDTEGVTVRNLVLRAAVPSVAECRVLECSADGFALGFSPASPAFGIDGGALVFDLDGMRLDTRDRKFSLHALDRGRIAFLFCGGHEENRDVLPTDFVSADAVRREGSKVWFRNRPDAHPKCARKFPYAVGEPVAILLESDRHRDQMLFEDCSDVVVEDVRIESGVGMGVIAQHCVNVRVDGLDVVPRPGSRVALTADAVYVSSCKGKVEILRSNVVGGLDDPLNVHCVYTVLESVSGRSIVVRAWKDGLRDGLFPYAPGDELEFFSWQGTNRVCRGTAVVRGFRRLDALSKTAEIELDRDVPAEWVGQRVGNLSLAPRVVIRGNRFERTLNFRLSAYGDVLIENNVFRRCCNVLHANDLTDWAGEGGPIRRLTVRNNDIDGCGDSPFEILVPPRTPPVLEGNRIGSGGYTSLLRVSARVLEDDALRADLWREVDARPGAFDEITVFSQGVHSIRPLAYHRRAAERAARFVAEARERRLRVGINVLCMQGFFDDAADPSLQDMPYRLDCKGDVVRGSLCPRNPRTLDYVTRQSELYAAARPDFIYVDDDVSGACVCFCGLCSGSDASAAAGGVQDAIFAAVAKGVRAVSPTIGIGVMSYVPGTFGLDLRRWGRTLSSGSSGAAEVRWRPGGGVWNDQGTLALLDKLESCSAQVLGLDASVRKVQGEVENFPYAQLSKSPDFMGFEALAYLGWCANGIAWNFCAFNAEPLSDYAAYFDKCAEIAPTARRLAADLAFLPASGLSFPGKTTRTREIRRVPGLCAAGLPTASDPRFAPVVLLDAPSVGDLDDGELRRVLSGGVLMDAGALSAVNARGFSACTGFRVGDQSPRDAITRDLDHPLNVPGRHVRDLRGAFGANGVPDGSRNFPLIVRTAETARFTREAVDIERTKTFGGAAGVFENPLGGRVAVESFVPFEAAGHSVRAEDMKRLCRWLSRDTLPGYVSSFHPMAIRLRGNAVFALNLAPSKVKDVEVALREGGRRTCLVMESGVGKEESALAPVRRDGSYWIYRVPSIPSLGQVLLCPENCGDGL